MSAFADLVRFTPTLGGTTDWVVSTAVGGCQTPALANVLNGVSYKVYAVSTDLTQWEISTGVYNSGTTTFPRTTVLYNSSGTGTATGQSGAGTKINFSTVPQVSLIALAEDLISVEIANAFSAAQQTRAQANIGVLYPPQGRLTLTSGTAVMTTSVTAATTVFYTPSNGNIVPIYDGTSMLPTAFPELSQTTTDTTKSPAACTTNSNYDLFVWNDSGTLRCTRGPVWTNDTTRSAGTALVLVNGIFLNNASITNGPAASRGTYVGTIRTNGTSTVDWTYGTVAAGGGPASFGIWNAYNRVPFATIVSDSTDNWTYNTAIWRAPNGNTTTMRVSAIRGLDIDSIWVEYQATSQAGAASAVRIGVGLNKTNGFSGTSATSSVTSIMNLVGKYSGLMGLGFNFASAVEYNSGASAGTSYGDAGDATQVQTGLQAEMWQ